MNIAEEFPEIAVILTQGIFESPLEKVPMHPSPGIDAAGISRKDALHDYAEGDLRYTQEQMQVVGHKAMSE